MELPEFKAFAKIARLNRDIVVTEKIDGTNGVIYVPDNAEDPIVPGSRNQWLVNGVDNFGFARWAYEHQNDLREKLGPGYHYGEWWGSGIQRRYEQKTKVFSLFNVSRWTDPAVRPECCSVVPVLYSGIFSQDAINDVLASLIANGSWAAPGFMQPEGVVIFHTASNSCFKVTIQGDAVPKTKG